jgi:hypothetical protein
MLSDKQHIDDFFRKKEEAFMPDDQHLAAHWQQMQSQMTAPDPAAAGNTTGTQIVRRIGKFLGGLLTVAIIAILAIQINRSNKKAISKTKQQATIATTKTAPASKQEATVVMPETTEQQAEINNPAPAVNKVNRPEIAMNLIAPPITKEQPPLPTGEIQTPDAQSRKNENDVNAPKPDAQALLKSFFDELKNDDQEFYIQTARDTTLIAKEGTRLVIPANIFATQKGPAKGQVRIIIREYIKYEDIIANKLSTTSNGEQLVTGGMLHISAQQDGKEVTIAQQKSITVSIPTSHFDNRMKLFTGIEQTGDALHATKLNWLPEETFRLMGHGDRRKIQTINLGTVQPVSVNYGKKTTAKFFLSSTIDMPKAEIKEQLKQRFGSYYDNIKIRRVQPGKVKRRPANGEPFIIDIVDMDPDEVINKKTSAFQDSLPYAHSLRKYTTFSYEKREKQRAQYKFIISQMGWINCDYFKNAPRPLNSLTVDLGNDISFTDCASQLVFTNYQSVLYPYFGYGNKIKFQNLPSGDQAILVIVAVKDGKIVSSFVPVTTSEKEIGNLTFEPTTPEQFRRKLKPLLPSQLQ